MNLVRSCLVSAADSYLSSGKISKEWFDRTWFCSNYNFSVKSCTWLIAAVFLLDHSNYTLKLFIADFLRFPLFMKKKERGNVRDEAMNKRKGKQQQQQPWARSVCHHV